MYGTVFDNHINKINAGGTHEENPNGGVLMAEDEQYQDLVEEGEVIYGDYVFSNRITIPQDFRTKFKIKPSLRTYADVAEYFAELCQKEGSSNAAINTLRANMSRLSESQEIERQKMYQERMDKFLASLSDEEKAELMQLVQEQQQEEGDEVEEQVESSELERNGQIPSEQNDDDMTQEIFACGGKLRVKHADAGQLAVGAASAASSVLQYLDYLSSNPKEDYDMASRLRNSTIGSYQHINAQQVGTRLNAIDADYSSELADIKSSFQQQLADIEDGQGSMAQKRIAKQRLLSQMSKALSDAAIKGRQANEQNRLAVAKENAGIEAQNAQLTLAAQKENAANLQNAVATGNQMFLNAMRAEQDRVAKERALNEQKYERAKSEASTAAAAIGEYYDNRVKEKAQYIFNSDKSVDDVSRISKAVKREYENLEAEELKKYSGKKLDDKDVYKPESPIFQASQYFPISQVSPIPKRKKQ
jgi:hypothetical protein